MWVLPRKISNRREIESDDSAMPSHKIDISAARRFTITKMQHVSVCVMAGIFFTVAMAWCGSIYSPLDFGHKIINDAIQWPRKVEADWPQQPSSVSFSHSAFISGVWYQGYGENPIDRTINPTLFRLVVIETGWPMRAMVYERTLVMKDARGTIEAYMDECENGLACGVALPSWMPVAEKMMPDEFQFRRIPLRPVLIGFTINSLLWMTTMMFVIKTIRCGIKRLRNRSMRCAVCGYELPELTVCPECGADSLRQRC